MLEFKGKSIVMTVWKEDQFNHFKISLRSVLSASPYSVQKRENVDQNNSEYGHFLRSVSFFILIEF